MFRKLKNKCPFKSSLCGLILLMAFRPGFLYSSHRCVIFHKKKILQQNTSQIIFAIWNNFAFHCLNTFLFFLWLAISQFRGIHYGWCFVLAMMYARVTNLIHILVNWSRKSVLSVVVSSMLKIEKGTKYPDIMED